PPDVVEATKRRVLDVMGLALAGAETAFGRSVRDAATVLSPEGPCRIFGTGERVAVTTAAFVNGSGSEALGFDATHNESIVHMSSPSVTAALALAEFLKVHLKVDPTYEPDARKDLGSAFRRSDASDVGFALESNARSKVGSAFGRNISGGDLILAIAIGNE